MLHLSPPYFASLQRPLSPDNLALLADRCDAALLSQLLWMSAPQSALD